MKKRNEIKKKESFGFIYFGMFVSIVLIITGVVMKAQKEEEIPVPPVGITETTEEVADNVVDGVDEADIAPTPVVPLADNTIPANNTDSDNTMVPEPQNAMPEQPAQPAVQPDVVPEQPAQPAVQPEVVGMEGNDNVAKAPEQPQGSGPLTKDEIKTVMQGALPAVHTCAKASKAKGQIVVSFVVKAEGKAGHVKVTKSDTNDEKFKKCVTKVVGGLKFRATDKNVPVTYPFLL